LKDNHIIGALLIGEISNSGLYARLIREKADISKIKDDLLDRDLSYIKISEVIDKKEKIYI
jgi:NAD(P)H-nitrite reductase large subunit